MFEKFKNIAAGFKRELQVYRLVLKHKNTPLVSKILLWTAFGYLMLPFDLIPDFIPVIGHLDDVIIIPLLVYFALKFIPAYVIEECRNKIKG